MGRPIANEELFPDDADSLRQKELIVIHLEEDLLNQRITLMRDQMRGLSPIHPHYSTFKMALDMDQIELEELYARKAFLLWDIT